MDILSLYDWSKTLLLNFYPEMCKIMRIGQTPVHYYDYSLSDFTGIMERSISEKDIGVIIDY